MDKNVLKLTKSRLLSQKMVPASPGCIGEDGQPLLCLGAAFVAAHLELTEGAESADAFARAIVKQDSSAGIVKTARRSGFPEMVCRMAIAMNDNYANSKRREGVLSFLRQFEWNLAAA